jgi:hypothetical protein
LKPFSITFARPSQIFCELPVFGIEMLSRVTCGAQYDQVAWRIVFPVSINMMQFKNSWNSAVSAFLAKRGRFFVMFLARFKTPSSLAMDSDFWRTSSAAITLPSPMGAIRHKRFSASNTYFRFYKNLATRSATKLLVLMPGISFKCFATSRADANHVGFTCWRATIKTAYRTMFCSVRRKAIELFAANRADSLFFTSSENCRTVSGAQSFVRMFASKGELFFAR